MANYGRRIRLRIRSENPATAAVAAIPRPSSDCPAGTLVSDRIGFQEGTAVGAAGATGVASGGTAAGLTGGGRTSVTVLPPPKLTALPIMKSLFRTDRLADCEVPKKRRTGV